MRKDCVARELTREMVVGAFMLMILLGLGYFTIILSREAWFQKKQPVEVRFHHVMGLREGDNVVVRGMPVGKVSALELQGEWVHVNLTLDRPVQLRRDYRCTIVSTSILGGRYLELEGGSAEQPELPAGTVLVGQDPYDLMADAAKLINAVKEGVVDGGVVDNLREMAAEFREISARLRDGKGTLGRLLSEDETMIDDLQAAVASLREVAGRVERGEGTLGRLLSSEDSMGQDLADSLASLKTISARLEKGEGLIGRLLTDDTLYAELEAIVRETRAAVDDFRETSPVTTFTSIFFGAL